jgi:hypothetical protein
VPSKKPTIGYMSHDWSWGTNPLQPNGCTWYRCTLPGQELNKRGWVTAVGLPGFNPDKGFGILTEDRKQAIHGWDIVFFKLIMSKQALEVIPEAKKMGQKIVVDIDDWFEGLAPTNRAFMATDPKLHPDNNREIYAEIIEQADAVITSTQFLFDFYSQKRNNVFLVRNGIDTDRWKRRHARPGYPLRLGWVGATPWRSGDLEILQPFIGDYLRTRGMKFHHSGHTDNGAPKAATQLGISENIVKTLPLVPISHYPNLFLPIDIGIVPLNNVPFNHAKSFIKGLEYAAAGVPFVASWSPEYEYLSEKGIGRIAKTEEEWIYHLDELKSPRKRRDEIEYNLEMLKEFSMDKRGDDWDATMRYILEKI